MFNMIVIGSQFPVAKFLSVSPLYRLQISEVLHFGDFGVLIADECVPVDHHSALELHQHDDQQY